MKDGMYSNTVALLGFTILLMGSQVLAANMVYFKRYKWRKVMHVGWCCHSLLTMFCKFYLVFTIAGVLFICVIFLSEGCVVFNDIIQENSFGDVFVSV